MKFIRLTILLFAVIHSSAHAAVTLDAINSSVSNNEEMVVLKFNQEPDFKYFKLDKPNRLVIDLKKTVWNINNKKVFEYKKHVIKKIRYGIQQGYDLRLVIESDSKLEITDLKSYKTKSGYEMVFKLKDPKYVKQRKPILIIDPGHGGIDAGASGKKLKIHEKNVTLEFAKTLQKELQKTHKYEVLLTRTKDEYVTLHNRVKFAAKNNADLFISIHADSHKDRKVKGLSVYTLSETASDKEAAALARTENKTDKFFGLDLSGHDESTTDMLLDLAFRQQMNMSATFAKILISQLAKQVNLIRNTHRYAGFRVLKNLNVPSVLVELGYLSNPDEERLLNTKTYQTKIIKSLIKAIDKYFP